MLHFDIDTDQVNRLASELGATQRQVVLAFSRALARTAATLRRMSERGLRDELQLRTLKYLRVRLRAIKLRANASGDGFRLWYGLNDMPVGEFKGRPSKTATGVTFRGQDFKGGFVGRTREVKNKEGRVVRRSQATIFQRRGAERLPIDEAKLEVKDQMEVFVEDKVFTEAEDVFWRHFERDLAARTRLGIGEK